MELFVAIIPRIPALCPLHLHAQNISTLWATMTRLSETGQDVGRAVRIGVYTRPDTTTIKMDFQRPGNLRRFVEMIFALHEQSQNIWRSNSALRTLD